MKALIFTVHIAIFILHHLPMDIGITLRKLRTQKNYSQQFIANCLDISREAYKKWEKNKVNFSIKQLKKVAELYELETHEIIKMSYMKSGKSKIRGSTI